MIINRRSFDIICWKKIIIWNHCFLYDAIFCEFAWICCTTNL